MVQLIAVVTGCLSVVCGCLVLLILVLQAPVGHSFSPSVARLHSELWHYLLAEPAVLINHAQLSMAEERHMLDVKRLLQQLFIVTPLLFIFCGLSVYCLRLPCRLLCRWVAISGFVGLTIVLSGVFVIGFRESFVYFHTLLFPAGTWWFAPESGLIQAFPPKYFGQFSLAFCVLLLSIWGALYLYAAQLKR